MERIEELTILLSKHKDLKGVNVTIPYKKQVISYLDEVSEEVKQMSACNCIKIIDNRLIGYNTDVTGFELSLLPLLKPFHTKALVLGTGGAAAAVAYVLNKLKIEFLFVSRSNKIGGNFINYNHLNKDLLCDYTLIINTTPLGMFPNVEEYPSIPFHYLSNRHYLFDLVYNPEETMFLKKGKERGTTIKNGSDMLAIQADESWRIWTES